MRRGKMIAAVLTVCAVGAGMTVNAYAASTTFEMRKKTVRLEYEQLSDKRIER